MFSSETCVSIDAVLDGIHNNVTDYMNSDLCLLLMKRWRQLYFKWVPLKARNQFLSNPLAFFLGENL
jgi:hypothetical protein